MSCKWHQGGLARAVLAGSDSGRVEKVVSKRPCSHFPPSSISSSISPTAQERQPRQRHIEVLWLWLPVPSKPNKQTNVAPCLNPSANNSKIIHLGDMYQALSFRMREAFNILAFTLKASQRLPFYYSWSQIERQPVDICYGDGIGEDWGSNQRDKVVPQGPKFSTLPPHLQGMFWKHADSRPSMMQGTISNGKMLPNF